VVGLVIGLWLQISSVAVKPSFASFADADWRAASRSSTAFSKATNSSCAERAVSSSLDITSRYTGTTESSGVMSSALVDVAIDPNGPSE
jgi:hypothetical protein